MEGQESAGLKRRLEDGSNPGSPVSDPLKRVRSESLDEAPKPRPMSAAKQAAKFKEEVAYNEKLCAPLDESERKQGMLTCAVCRCGGAALALLKPVSAERYHNTSPV